MSGESLGILAAMGLNNSKLENVGEAFEDPDQVHLRSSDSLTSQTLLRIGNESGLTSRVKSDFSNTRAYDPPVTGRRERSDDERRLLGDYEKDPDAVPINRPQNPAWYSRMTPGIVKGGPQPTNTLGSGGSTRQTINRDFKAAALKGSNSLKRGHQGGSQKSLDIVTSSGDNVMNSGKPFDLHEDCSPRKKHCPTAAPAIQSESRYQIRMADDDELSMFNNGKARRFPPLPVTNYNSSNFSLGSEVFSNSQILRGLVGRGGIPEYRLTEETMNSRQNRRRRPRRSQPATVTPGVTPQVTIDLCTDDPVVANQKQPYQGTARETKSRGTSTGEKHRNTLHKYETGPKSRHFQNANKPKISSSMRGSNARPAVQQAEQPNLRSSFVDDVGRRRASLMGDSADELQNGTTVGSYSCEVQSSPAHTQLRSSEPLKDITIRPRTPPHQVLGLPESNIRSTKFISSRRQSRKVHRVEEAPRNYRPTTEWGGDLVNFRTDSADLHGRTSCGLAYDPTKEKFVVMHEGRDLSEGNPELRITPTSVTRITIGDDDSCKVRLLVSRSGNLNPWIDIELGSHENAVEFIQALQAKTPGIKVKLMKSDKMDQVFERRASEYDPQLQFKNKPKTDMGDDIQLLEAKERLKKAKAGTTRSGPEVYGQRSSRNDTADATCKLGRTSILGDHPQSSRDSSTLLQRTIAAGHDREAGSKTHQAHIRNQHQTRSKVQQFASDSPIPTKSSPEPLLEKRYSKLHGLGSPWAKPLVFPQAGKRKATVEFEDLQRLDEGEFLNDNLMGFYLRYLEYQLEQKHGGLAQKIYFFNTYFFASLTNTPRGKKGVHYEAVQKWTRTVDIFAFDYVVVPINESAHWYVAIICNLPALDRKLEAEDQTDSQAAVGVSSDKALSLSSRAASSSVVDDIENKAAIYDIDADGTRNSFAEMNLEGRQEPYSHDMAEDTMLEDEIGHRPNEESRKEDGSLEHPTIFDLEITGASPSTAQLSNDNSPSILKKGRRKSTARLQKYESGGPIIITLDSLGLSHSPTIRILKDYLAQEGKEKRALEYPEDAIKGMTAKGIPLQNNFCDCGLYLLGYLDKLVLNPQDLIHKILQRELDADVDWPALNPSHMRHQLRTEIQELHREQEAERKETAKKTGKYIGRGHAKPAIGSGSLELPPSMPLPNSDEGPKQDSKATRKSALESAFPLDQELQSKVGTNKDLPMIEPSFNSSCRENTAHFVTPRASSYEDSPIYVGEKPVTRGTSGTRDLKRPIRRSKDGKEQASESHTAPSPKRYLEKVEIPSRNPTLGDGDMLEV